MTTNDSKDQGREALTDEQLATLKAAAIIATPQDIDGAERIEHFTDGSRYLECPVCGGEGTVNLEGDFCNYDGHALGVQFYGIGPEHGAAEAYFRAVKPATVLALIERLERAESAVATSASALARDEASVAGAETGFWRCFHCDEVFTDKATARDHFGSYGPLLMSEPACQIDAAEYRAMEKRMTDYNAEDADIHRQMRKMESDHAFALRREEEKGYARGLSDGIKEAAPAASSAATVSDAASGLTDDQIIEIASRYAHSDGWLNGDGALNFARALLATSQAATAAGAQDGRAGCELCNGVGKIGIPGQRCFACDGSGKSFADRAASSATAPLTSDSVERALDRVLKQSKNPLFRSGAKICAAEILSPTKQCTKAPEGWSCSRVEGHEGPCAASQSTNGEQS